MRRGQRKCPCCGAKPDFLRAARLLAAPPVDWRKRPRRVAVLLGSVMPINGPLFLIPKSHRQGVLDAGHDKLTTSYPLWTLDNETMTRLVD